MQSTKNIFASCPDHILKEITEFLNFSEKLKFSLISKDFQHIKPVYIPHLETKKLMSKQDCILQGEPYDPQWDRNTQNYLYHKVQVSPFIDHNGAQLRLSRIIFTFETRGFCSWILGLFIKKSQLEVNHDELKREKLVRNFDEKKFRTIKVLIDRKDILEDLALIKIYLVSIHPYAVTRNYCKKSDIKLLYE